MSLYRFYVEGCSDASDKIYISGKDYNHIKNVLRLRPGEEIIISDGTSRDYHCKIADFTEDESVAAEIIDITDNATDISNSTNENTTAVSKEEKEGSSFKTLEISLKLITYLNSLKNLTTIEKEQLRGIFQNIYNLIVDDPEKKLNSSDSEMIDKFTDEVYQK